MTYNHGHTVFKMGERYGFPLKKYVNGTVHFIIEFIY